MNRLGLPAYGAMGFPLAFAAMTAYVVAPHFYGTRTTLSLATIGAVLLLTRLIDGALDPWLGRLAGRLAVTGRLAIGQWGAALLLSVGFAALWLPPTGEGATVWLAASLLGLSLGHSLLNIALLGRGAQLSADPAVITRASLWREGFGLAGVLGAAALADTGRGTTPSVAIGLLVASLLAALVLMRRATPPQPLQPTAATRLPWSAVWRDRSIRRLLAAYTVSATASSIAATLGPFTLPTSCRRPPLLADCWPCISSRVRPAFRFGAGWRAGWALRRHGGWAWRRPAWPFAGQPGWDRGSRSLLPQCVWPPACRSGPTWPCRPSC
jgi:Na+/melibiose symporter-like transporter